MKKKLVVALMATMVLSQAASMSVFAMRENQFSDVSKNDSFYSYVESVVDSKYMVGENGTEFGVGEKTSRYDLIDTLYKVAKEPLCLDDVSFEDVKEFKDMKVRVAWAESKNLFDGLKEDFFKDGKFDAEKDITREEMSVILYNYAKNVDKLDMNKGLQGGLDIYDDKDKVEKTYEDEMKWVVGKDFLVADDRLTEDVEKGIRPTEAAKKVEVAEAVAKYVKFRDTLKAEENKGNSNGSQNNEGSNQGNGSETGSVETPSTPWIPLEPSTPNTDIPLTPIEPSTPHVHEWHDNIVGYIHHDEEGHYETQKVLVKDAWDEIVKHPEEGHYETQTIPAWDEIVKHPEEGHYEKVLVKDAWDEIVHHPAEYEDKWIVDKPAWTETIKHPEEGHYEKVEVSPEEGHYEFHYICNGCGQDFGGGDAGYNAVHAHNKEQMLQGNTACGGYHDDQVWVVDKEAVYEDRWVVDKEAWTETIEHPEEGHTEKVLVKEAWDETVHHPAEYEDKWIVDKEAWEETIHHPEETKEVWVVDKEAWEETIHHEAVYEDKEVWVVDKEAWDEPIIMGQYCDCGVATR